MIEYIPPVRVIKSLKYKIERKSRKELRNSVVARFAAQAIARQMDVFLKCRFLLVESEEGDGGWEYTTDTHTDRGLR